VKKIINSVFHARGTPISLCPMTGPKSPVDSKG
jgi:hypothetical protein